MMIWVKWAGQVLKSGTYLYVNVDTASDIIAAYPEAQRTAHAQHGQKMPKRVGVWQAENG